MVSGGGRGEEKKDVVNKTIAPVHIRVSGSVGEKRRVVRLSNIRLAGSVNDETSGFEHK